jgi:hypothetical protein
MLVLNLACGHDHAFEGWFASAEDFESQRQRSLVECPMCGDRTIERRPSAPRIQTGRHADAPAAADSSAELMRAVRHVLAHTEDVGNQFAEEARRIHYGEAPERSIRGKSSLHEVAALAEEGISVLPLALPSALKEPLQ